MELTKRKPNRLKKYDYSKNGGYFITICTKDRKQILSKITKDKNYDIVGDGFAVPQLTKYGIIVDKYINLINTKYPMIKVDKYVIMPNHIHLLLIIESDGTANPSPTIGSIIGWFKYSITKYIDESTNIFQRSFHDHIIRNKNDYLKIWEYIDNNPLKWELDCYYK
ncbi:MAG: transposase [Clostridiales bacterium]|nr:transposase [Clostridiales bacterium]